MHSLLSFPNERVKVIQKERESCRMCISVCEMMSLLKDRKRMSISTNSRRLRSMCVILKQDCSQEEVKEYNLLYEK